MRRTGTSLSAMQLKIIRVRKKDLSVNDVWRNSIYGAERNCNMWPQWIVSMKKQGGLKLLFRVNNPFMLSPASFVILVPKTLRFWWYYEALDKTVLYPQRILRESSRYVKTPFLCSADWKQEKKIIKGKSSKMDIHKHLRFHENSPDMVLPIL